MAEMKSNFNILGHADFDLSRVSDTPGLKCPVRDCSTTLVDLLYGRRQDRDGRTRERTKPWCSEHRIRLHSNTFVYWNDNDQQEDARLRNFIVKKGLAKKIALRRGVKAEAHRLGYEMSEDALSWNVFVSLAFSGRLKQTAEFLTNRSLSTEPTLYLWGYRIDLMGREYGTYPPLKKVREYLEAGIHGFCTEPDIMLVVENEILICIEAKFGSGNPLAYEGDVKAGEKPVSRDGLLARYLGAAEKTRRRATIRPDQIGYRLHSQLFRNIVFASEMAEAEWHVVNLVSRTQRNKQDSSRHSFLDPTDDILGYLSPDSQSCFTYRTWEDLTAAVIKDTPELAELDAYLRGKSAHYRPAFDLQ
jgi:hypothetical protein